jgi:hypothetical protein
MGPLRGADRFTATPVPSRLSAGWHRAALQSRCARALDACRARGQAAVQGRPNGPGRLHCRVHCFGLGPD